MTADGTRDFTETVASESRSWVAAAAVIVGDRDRGEEVVQEVLARLFPQWSRVAGMDRPGAWVRRAVINEAITTRRRMGRERVALSAAAAAAAASAPAPEIGPGDPGHELWAAVRALPDDQARAIALRYAGDYPVAAVAEALDVSEAAARTLLYRARRTLRNELDGQEVER